MIIVLAKRLNRETFCLKIMFYYVLVVDSLKKKKIDL